MIRFFNTVRYTKFLRNLSSFSNKMGNNEGIEPSLSKSAAERRPNYNRFENLGDGRKFEVLPPPIKSESDKKEYRVIRLANGLTVCLISDPSSIEDVSDDDDEEESDHASIDSSDLSDSFELVDDMDSSSDQEEKLAACALGVGVGSFSDPEKFQGMAHFLEHMVFMGTEKFPSENDFDAFLSRRGGESNAVTEFEVTTFYFGCLERDLSTALDKFAQFFISPLMHRHTITRERQAIQSEFQMALQSNTNRRQQLFCSFAKKDAPVNSFSWGNDITLRDTVDTKELYEGVHEFRKRHYSANRMTAAIQARLPLHVLQSYALKYFAKIPNNSLPADDFQAHNNVFDTPNFTKLYYVEPATVTTQIDLTWALPSLLDKYKSKPHHYISWLLGHEGKNSLLSYLRKKVWVLSMTSGNDESGYEHNSLYCLFSISMVLTDEGLKNINEIIKIIFSYINMMRKWGPQERIYNEIKQIGETAFKFATEETAADIVEPLVEAMHFFPPEHYLNGTEIFFEYDADGIKGILEMFVPEKMNVMILTNELPAGLTFDQTEPWFGTRYTAQDISNDSIVSWKNAEPLEDFSLPLPNEYISTNFEILPEEENHPEYPQQVLKTDVVEMWFRKDEKFKLPTAFFHFYLIKPKVSQSPLTATLRDLFINMLQIHLMEDMYPAQEAGLSYIVKPEDNGIVFKFSGYNEKLHLLVYLVAEHIVNFEKSMDENLFLAMKDKLIKFYYNSLLKPKSLSTDVRLNVLLHPYPTTIKKYTAALTITFDQLKEFTKDFIGTLRIKALAQGNITQHHAIDVVSRFIDILQCGPIDSSLYLKPRVFQIPNGANYCYLESFNKNDPNSVITNYYQSGVFSIEEDVIVELLTMIVHEPLFHKLRTREQLGYDVSCVNRNTYGVLGFSITAIVQATKYTTQHIDDRIDKFVKYITTILNKMTERSFATTKQSLIQTKQITDVHLKEEVSRNWAEITEDDYIFDRDKQEIAALQNTVTLQKVKEWWISHTEETSEKFRKLSVQVSGFDVSIYKNQERELPEEQLSLKLLNLESECSGKPQQDRVILDVDSFRNEMLLLYPHVCKCFEPKMQ